MPSQFMLIGFLRLTILATAYLIPLYLGSVRGFRALEVGETLVWIAAPQLILCPLSALMLRRTDARLVGLDRLRLHQRRLPHGGLHHHARLGVAAVSAVAAAAGGGAELRAVGRDFLRHPALEAPGRADVRRGAADGPAHGRRDRHGIHRHARPGCASRWPRICSGSMCGWEIPMCFSACAPTAPRPRE